MVSQRVERHLLLCYLLFFLSLHTSNIRERAHTRPSSCIYARDPSARRVETWKKGQGGENDEEGTCSSARSEKKKE